MPKSKQQVIIEGGVPENTIIGTNFETFSTSTTIKNRPKRVDLEHSPILKAYESIDWDIIIIDESTCIKDPTSKIALAMLNLTYNVPDAYVMCLTGTPNPEESLDFYTQISVVDRGKRFGQSFNAWRNKYFYRPPYSYNWVPFPFGPEGHSIKEVISDLCKDLCYVLTDVELKEKIHLPEKRDIDVQFILENKTNKYYLEMKNNVLSLKDTDITAQNAAIVISKLLQLSSGIIYDNGIGTQRQTHFIGLEKIKALITLINTINGKIIVCYNFNASYDNLCLYLDLYNIEYANASEITEQEFASSKTIKVLLLQPASCAYGSNYQEDCHIMIWYEGQSSGEKFSQTEARIYRQGQKKECIFYYLLGKGTYDKLARDKTRDKKTKALDILLAIQDKQKEEA